MAAGLPDSLSRAPAFSTRNNNYSNKATISTTIAEVVEQLSKMLQKNATVAKQMRNS